MPDRTPDTGVLRGILLASPLPILAISADGTVLEWNPAAERLFGWSATEVVGYPLPFVPEGKESEFRDIMSRAMAGEVFTGLEISRLRKDGSLIDLNLSTAPLRDSAGVVFGIVSVLSDITQRKRAEAERESLEERMRQMQRLEALGRLAGGVAHDFNNILTAIDGYCELLLRHVPAGDPNRREVEEIRKAGDRAAGLTRQLLAYSRKQVLSPRSVSLNTVVSGMETMLRRLIGEHISLVVSLDPCLCRVKADPGQLEQILANLAVNARDAMPTGGELRIGTANLRLGKRPERAGFPGVPPGDYAMLTVADTGSGMDAETVAHIFEPFFTTKAMGKGTGLGLATVYGVVSQSGGHIAVESRVGEGTRFKIVFPYLEEEGSAPAEETKAVEAPKGGKETLLLVEDEEMVRELFRDILAEHGYHVLCAGSGAEAIALSELHRGEIPLMITDVVMPGMSGKDLADRLGPRRPQMSILFISGYTDDEIARHGVLEAEILFLQKPFSPMVLVRKVREILDGKG